MLYHILAILDILSVIILLLGQYGLTRIPLLYAAVYLLSKLFFFRDVLTFIDAGVALYFLYVFFVQHGTGLTWLVVIYFAYKTITWLFYSFAT